MAKVKVLKLKVKDQKELDKLTKSGTIKSRKLNRCRILLLASQGKTKQEIAEILNISPATAFTICGRYLEGGLENALNERPRPGAPNKFSGKELAKITALACSKPPQGKSRWTLRLLSDKAVELKIVRDISYMSIDRTLKKTNLSLT